MKRKAFISIVVLLVLSFLFLLTMVNREDLSYSSNYESVNASTIRKEIEHSNQFYLIIISSTCSGKYELTPILKENIEKLKQEKIPFLLIADEIYNQSLDSDIHQYKEEFGLNEKVYILDKNKYPKNGGLFNDKRRYKEFLIDLLGENNNVPLGYIMYLKFENGKFENFYDSVK